MSHVAHEDKNAPRIGSVLAGKYVVERVIGVGAMGVVVAAQHRLLKQTVALKLISASREHRENAVARFTREARAIAGLSSDHVVRVLDFGLLEDGRPFMVMQYLAGRDLSSEVRARGGKLPVTEAVDYVIHACAGLAVAHAAGIIHRDIKPGNLLLTTRPSGEPLVVIVDFGISKTAKQSEEERSLTISRITLGSPLYMSPEQIRDPKTVDARTDIWSLGVVLRFLLTGKPAFSARDASGVLAAVLEDEPAPVRADAPEVTPELEDVVLRCLEKKAAFRFESVAALAHALAPFASPEGAALAKTIVSSAPAPAKRVVTSIAATQDGGTFASTMSGAVRPLRRRAIGRWVAIAVAVLACGAAILAWPTPHLGPDEPEAAAHAETPVAVSWASASPAARATATKRAAIDPPVSAAPAGSSRASSAPAERAVRTPNAPKDPLDTAK